MFFFTDVRNKQEMHIAELLLGEVVLKPPILKFFQYLDENFIVNPYAVFVQYK